MKFWSKINKRKGKNIFLVSSPRSGTTWLTSALMMHPDVFCTERRLFGGFADLILDEGVLNPRLRVTLDRYVDSVFLHNNLDVQKKEIFLSEIINSIRAQEVREQNAQVYIDKITPYRGTSDIVYSGITKYFPESKIVSLSRDGRDVVVSGVFHWMNKQRLGVKISPFETKRIENLKHEDSNYSLPRFFTDEEVVEWASMWKEPVASLKAARARHNVLDVKYSEMLQDQRKVLKKLFDFFGVNYSNRILDACVSSSAFDVMAIRMNGEHNLGKHVRKGGSGDWVNYFTRKDGELFQEVAGEELLLLGYVNNKTWYKELPDSLLDN